MIFSLVGTLSPALDSQFQKARRELSGKLRELTEQPPLVRTGGGGVARRPRSGLPSGRAHGGRCPSMPGLCVHTDGVHDACLGN